MKLDVFSSLNSRNSDLLVLRKNKAEQLERLDDDIDDGGNGLPSLEKMIEIEPLLTSSSARKQSVERLKKEMKDRK